MTHIFDVILKQHAHCPKPDICIFYDEDRNLAIKEMQKYVRQNGFSYKDGKSYYTIATLILRERESTGKVISEKMYHELFDTIHNKPL